MTWEFVYLGIGFLCAMVFMVATGFVMEEMEEKGFDKLSLISFAFFLVVLLYPILLPLFIGIVLRIYYQYKENDA